jgi:hypothetical protein
LSPTPPGGIAKTFLGRRQMSSWCVGWERLFGKKLMLMRVLFRVGKPIVKLGFTVTLPDRTEIMA